MGTIDGFQTIQKGGNPMYEKCTKCQEVRKYLDSKTPKGWMPFAWGPEDEEPCHFYVISEDTPDPIYGEEQEVDTTKLCEVPNPERR